MIYSLKTREKIVKKIQKFCKNNLMIKMPESITSDPSLKFDTPQYYCDNGDIYEIVGCPICKIESKTLFYKNKFTREALILKDGDKILFFNDRMEIHSSSEVYEHFSYTLMLVPLSVDITLALNEMSQLYCREYLGFKVLNAKVNLEQNEKIEIAVLLGDIFGNATHKEFETGLICRKLFAFEFKFDVKANILYVLKDFKIVSIEYFCQEIFNLASNNFAGIK